MSDQLKLLVVANPEDSGEIAGLLAEAGLPEPAIGAGGDETFSLFEEQEPDLVVLSSCLDDGDARALAAAMRSEAGERPLQIILIGDGAGPIRTALDAADFEVDRFLSRPLSRKALAFAVRSCAATARQARDQERDRDREQGTAAAPDSSAAGDGLGDRLEAATNRAIETFVADAMEALDFGAVAPTELAAVGDMAPAMPSRQPTEVFEAPRREPTAVAEAPSREPTAVPEAPRRQPTEASKVPVGRAPIDSMSVDAGWDEPPAAGWREPTLILSGSAAPPQPAAPESPSPPLSAPSMSASDARSEGSSPWSDIASASSVEDELLDDVIDDGLVDAIGDDLSELDADQPLSGKDAEPPTGGAFARELRRKMSAMAERLFPGQAQARRPVGLAHDAHTEIDLTAIGVETVAGVPYSDISPADTFADTNPAAPASNTPTGDTDEITARGTGTERALPTRGHIAPGRFDVPSIIARCFSAKLTGRVVFRHAPAEKSILFEDGRPVFATSNLPHDRMGDLLFREGKITREQHARSRELVAESGRRMGEILVEMGFLKPRELLPAVRRHIEDIIYSLFSWDTGDFAVSPGEPSTERIRLSRHPAAVIVEGVRRKFDDDRLDLRLGATDTVVAPTSPELVDAVIGVADLSKGERTAIKSFDGERDLDEVAAASGLDRLTVRQLGLSLVCLGAGELLHRGQDDTFTQDSGRSPALVGETDLAIDRQRVLAKHALVEEADYFTLLGVRRDASGFEIRRAYEAARRDYAGDNFPSEVQRDLGEVIAEIGELIEEAYRVLSDDRVRHSYLTNLRD